MKTGILGLAVIGASLVFGAGPNVEEGFVTLFNGKNLTGRIGVTPMYGVENGGALRGQAPAARRWSGNISRGVEYAEARFAGRGKLFEKLP